MKRFYWILGFLSLIVVFSFNGFGRLYAQPDHLNFDNFTLENGLSNNIIHCACQDSRGYIWFGTNHGVCRFDGYRFTTFRNNPTDTTSLSGLLARVIYEDTKGNIWVGTESGGLNLFNRDKETFTHVMPVFDEKGIGSSVKCIAEDKNGVLWLGTNIGLKSFNTKSFEVKTYASSLNNTNSPSDNYIRALKFDLNGKLWIGTNSGLDIFNPVTGKFIRMYSAEPKLKDEIWRIYMDPKGNVLIGTYNNGFFVYNANTLIGKQIFLDKNNERSNAVRAIVCDKSGVYWIGTRDGLYLYNLQKNKTYLFENDEHESKSLVHNSILDILSDKNGNMWICTRGGISLMVPERQIFKHYKSLPNDNRYLNNNEIYAIWTNKNTGEIWLGTDKGGVNILNPVTQRYRYLMQNSGGAGSLTSNCIKAFMDDGQGNVWIGTFRGGINVYNLKTKRIIYYKNNPADPNSLSNNVVWALLHDKKGNIWVGTDSGLDRFDPDTRRFIHYRNIDQGLSVIWINEDSKGDLWLGQGSRTNIFRPDVGIVAGYTDQGRWFYEDSKGRYWVATMNNGLVLYDKMKGPQKYYDEKAGLPNNQVFYILEDYLGNLWLSTANGLSRFDPDKETFNNFDIKDGLQNNQFLYGAGFKSPSGEFLFGGINGFNVFNPKQVIKNTFKPPVVFSDFKIFNKSVLPGDFNSILTNSISATDKIEVPYKYNIITFEFAALNFAKSEKNRYKFKLVGFDKDWNESGFQRTATYTNLDPGSYTFCVIASNNDNVWNEKGISMTVKILPPFWKTWWFKLLIILTIFLIIYFIIVFVINREKLKHELILERVKAKQMHELDMMKLRFFTNISHEIRTPLTLILGPLDRLMQGKLSGDQIKSHIQIMHRNASLLLKLVNQLLDFRKLETGNTKLELRKGDIIDFLRFLVDSFKYLANEKDIQLKFNTVNDNLYAFFDADKLEKIMNNLLSNAFKFTEKSGSVTVNVSIVIDDTSGDSDQSENNNRYVEIVVKDTGIGIAEQNKDKIFTRFFQANENKNLAGTGIGLALTQELVKLHKGYVLVDSKPGEGSKFTIRLPLINELPGESIPSISGTTVNTDNFTEIVDKNKGKELLSDKIMLIVEDNSDVRQFIRINFESSFHIEDAADGKEGLDIARKLIPDIILTDVMMPVMDGIELCKRLKKDERTSHIPVLMLTALTSKENTLDGLSSGADDYIVKPFDIAILRTKIENLLSVRKALREKFSGEMILAPTNIALTSPDEKFLRKAIEIVEKNIDDSELDIETFSDELGVSRMQLYRKLSALTDMTVKEFIRDIRLKRAAQLLTQKIITVSEVAYAVGFKDLSHFRKCFREKFGMSATEYIDKNSNNE
jgi:ligand-binding sensor domain-containing protein/signal transduction histidine kinase/DNA-binding response OmpR family regulator